MPTELVPVVLGAGLNDGADPSLLQPGQLQLVRNGRPRRVGRLGKKAGLIAASMSTSAGTITGGVPNALTEWQGRPVLVANTNAWELTGSLWAQHGLTLTRFTPVGSDLIARASTTSSNVTLDPLAPSCAYASTTGRIVYVWNDGTNPYYSVYDDDGGCILSGAIPLASTTGVDCTAVAVGGTNVQIIVRRTADLRCITFDTSTLSFGSESSIGTLNAAGNFWDVAPFSSTQWLFAYQVSATDLRVCLMTGQTQTTTAALGIGGIAEGVSILGTPAENIYVSWTGGTVPGDVYGIVYAANLSSATAITHIYTASIAIGQPTMVRSSATAVQLYFTSYDETAFTAQIYQYNFTNAAIATLQGAAEHFRLASRAFADNGHFYVWGHTDQWALSGSPPSEGWLEQRTCYLLEASTPTVHLHAAPTLMTQRATTRLPAVIYASGATAPYFAYPALQVVLATLGTSALMHVKVLYYESLSENVRAAWRQWASDGQSVLFAGGVVQEYCGDLYENNFFYRPVIEDATVSGGGGVDDGDHYYRVVYEWVDKLGRRTRSGPSDPVLATTTAGNNTVTLKASTLRPGKNSFVGSQLTLQLAYVHIYRTRVGIAAFQRITPNIGVPVSCDRLGSATIITYVDTATDASIVDSEFLYTEGGVLPNALPPASRLICNGGNRMWLSGGFDPTVVTASKIVVSVEPTQFVDHDAFRINLPEPATAVAWGDGALIAWTKTGIYLVTGDGPNDQGQGFFSDPRRIPTDAGCIDPRSVAEIPAGWLYQSQRGFYILPRGFSSPIAIRDVNETIAAYPFILSSAVIRKPPSAAAGNLTGETEVRFLVSASAGGTVGVYELVFDANLGRFVSLDDVLGCLVGQYGQTVAHVTNASILVYETFANFASGISAFVPTTWRTGDIRPFGLLGEGCCHKIHLYGEWMGAASISVTATIDGVAQTSVSLNPKTLKGGATPSTRGERWYVEFHPAQDKFNSIDISVSDVAVSGASEGLAWLGGTLEVEGGPGTRRLASGARA